MQNSRAEFPYSPRWAEKGIVVAVALSVIGLGLYALGLDSLSAFRGSFAALQGAGDPGDDVRRSAFVEFARLMGLVFVCFGTVVAAQLSGAFEAWLNPPAGSLAILESEPVRTRRSLRRFIASLTICAIVATLLAVSQLVH